MTTRNQPLTNEKPLRRKKPENRSEPTSFLGLCNVYRRFIIEFTGMEQPLNKRIRKKALENFKLDEEQLK